MEPADAKDLIDEAIERAEEAQDREKAQDRIREKTFRDRVSILVGLFAVLLAMIHVAAAGNARTSILRTVEASDDFAYMQAKVIRETVLTAAAAAPGITEADRKAMLAQAHRLRTPDQAGHGIDQLRRNGDGHREQGMRASERGERYEWGETALQVAIVLLSIALVARSRPIVLGAVVLAVLGVGIATATALGLV